MTRRKAEQPSVSSQRSPQARLIDTFGHAHKPFHALQGGTHVAAVRGVAKAKTPPLTTNQLISILQTLQANPNDAAARAQLVNYLRSTLGNSPTGKKLLDFLDSRKPPTPILFETGAPDRGARVDFEGDNLVIKLSIDSMLNSAIALRDGKGGAAYEQGAGGNAQDPSNLMIHYAAVVGHEAFHLAIGDQPTYKKFLYVDEGQAVGDDTGMAYRVEGIITAELLGVSATDPLITGPHPTGWNYPQTTLPIDDAFKLATSGKRSRPMDDATLRDILTP